MTAFQVLYLIFGSFLVIGGISMITVYTLTNPWWSNYLGRMMVTYAAAEVLTSALFLSVVIGEYSPEWFRTAWFVLQVTIGLMLWFQTYAIIRLYRSRVNLIKKEDRS